MSRGTCRPFPGSPEAWSQRRSARRHRSHVGRLRSQYLFGLQPGIGHEPERDTLLGVLDGTHELLDLGFGELDFVTPVGITF